MGKILLFDHLPKTAGTSIGCAFSSIIKDYKISEFAWNAHHDVASRGYSFGGHIEFLPGESLNRNIYYCTVLRDPVDRVISQYLYHRGIAASAMKNSRVDDLVLQDYQCLSALACSFDKYITLGFPIDKVVINFQAKHFAMRLVKDWYNLKDDLLLDAAIASVEGYDLVGSFYNLQGFVDAVARDCNRDSVSLQVLNKTAAGYGDNGISKSAIDALYRASQVDYKLLHWADQRFGWQKQHAPKLLGRKIDHANSGLLSDNLGAADESIEDYGENIRITSVNCHGAWSGAMVIAPGEDLYIDVLLKALIAEPDITVGIAVRDKQGNLVYGVNSLLVGTRVNIDEPGLHTIRIKLKNKLDPGLYRITLALHKGRAHTEGCYHWLENAIAFAVISMDKQGYEGIVDCQAGFTKLERVNNG